MRVALDAQLAVGTATGIGEYVSGLAAALRRLGIDVIELWEPRLDPWRFDRRVVWDQLLLAPRARASGAAILHCASGTVPMAPGMPVVATVHDVAWLRVQRHERAYARFYFGRFALRRYRDVERIVVDSEFSRNELLALMNGYDEHRVRVVYPGVADDFCRLQRTPGDGRTILVAGTVERRKNLAAIVRAIAAIPSARVVSVGPPTAYQRECQALAARLGVADRVEFRGYVSRGQLLDLYASCTVVALASRYEGFGYAAAQALCAGVPCVVSDRSSLPEIVQSDAAIVPLDDIAAWTRALEASMAPAAREKAGAVRERSIRRFAWSTSAVATAEVYAQALSA